MQCQKSRRQCPGYKDDFDLVFRNETKATERRARRTLNSKRNYSPNSFPTGEISFAEVIDEESLPQVFSHLDRRGSLPLLEALSTPIEEQAPCFFISSYVLGADQSAKGYFDFLIPMMKIEPPDSCLTIAFSAVAMASLANRPNAKRTSLFSQAVYQYSKALKATNLALQHPEHQKSDQALASVLMLGFYEVWSSNLTLPT